MARFAEGTSVATSKTKAQIDDLLRTHGAENRAVGEADGKGTVYFALKNRHIKLEIKLKTAADLLKIGSKPRGWTQYDQPRREQWAMKEAEQANRESWRRLWLIVKAKLEMVAEGHAELESEFLANVVLPSGQTVGEVMREPIQNAYLSGVMPRLLGDGS